MDIWREASPESGLEIAEAVHHAGVAGTHRKILELSVNEIVLLT